jgi:hypothetical protein
MPAVQRGRVQVQAPVERRDAAVDVPMSAEKFTDAISRGTLLEELGTAYTRLTEDQRAGLSARLSKLTASASRAKGSADLPISSRVALAAVDAALGDLLAHAEGLGLVAPAAATLTAPGPAERFEASTRSASMPALDVGSMPQAPRVPQRGGVIAFEEKPAHTAKSPQDFYGAAKDDPAFGPSPSASRRSLTAAFVGKVLSRDPGRFANVTAMLTLGFLHERLAGHDGQRTWTSAFFQGMLMEVERRTGRRPEFGDVSFANLPPSVISASTVDALSTAAARAGIAGTYVNRDLDEMFLGNYCD